jgi:hypothetical protein
LPLPMLATEYQALVTIRQLRVGLGFGQDLGRLI